LKFLWYEIFLCLASHLNFKNQIYRGRSWKNCSGSRKYRTIPYC
jgi:hypothetical protein